MLLKTHSKRSFSMGVASLFLLISGAACSEGQAPANKQTKMAPASAQVAAPAAEADDANALRPEVLISTSMGDIVVELNAEKAPKTVANFLSYVDSGHYKNTIFHRVISNFMIQGGGFTPEMHKKPANQTVENEADNGLRNDLGTIAMARTNAPHSASAQFFLNTQDNGFLNHTSKSGRGWGYAVFGKVVSGGDIIQKIKMVPTTTRNRMRDVPMDPVIIHDIKRI